MSEQAASRDGAAIVVQRLQVGDDDGPHITLTAGDDAASIVVHGGAGGLALELYAAGDADHDAAGVTLMVDGDVYATFEVARSDDAAVRCQLVFDSPATDQPWTVIDRDGIRRDESRGDG